MKKLFLIFLLICVFLTGCDKNKEIDYSEYIFTDVVWTRDNGHDIETILFLSDGSFSYSCACGNPVNDSDLCEGYTYNDESKTIDFNYLESAEEMIASVKIVEVSEEFLVLDFDGEIRKFEKEK